MATEIARTLVSEVLVHFQDEAGLYRLFEPAQWYAAMSLPAILRSQLGLHGLARRGVAEQLVQGWAHLACHTRSACGDLVLPAVSTADEAQRQS